MRCTLGNEIYKDNFCRVCGFLVRVRESCRTSSNFGCGYGGVTELQKFRVLRHVRADRAHRSSGRVQKVLYVPVPRVLWHGTYRTFRNSGCGYECTTELTEVPGTDMKVELP